jgi:lysophospholipase L1-like esterase
MAELSALTTAAPLTGGEFLPALQSGNARKISLAQVRDFVQPLTFKVGARVAYMGDSITINGNSPVSYSCENYPFWTHYLGRQRYEFRPEWNFAVGGTPSDQQLALVSSVIAANPDIVVMCLGTNDVTQGYNFDASVANITSILDQLIAAGIAVVVLPILPRAISGQTSAMVAAIHRLNHWYRSVVWLRPGIIPCDPVDQLIDAASTNYAPVAATMRSDLIHPVPTGAIAIARALDPVLQRLVAPGSAGLTQSAADVWSASAPQGSLLGNGLFLGTAGTKQAIAPGLAPTGQFADGWTVQGRGDQVTLACAKAAHPTISGLPVQDITLGGTGNNGSGAPGVMFYSDVVPVSGNIAVGDTIEIIGELDYINLVGVQAVNVRLLDYAGSTLRSAASAGAPDSSGANLPSPFSASGVVRLPRAIIQSGMTYLRLRVDIWLVTGAALSGSLRFSRFAMRKVA